MVFFGLTMLWIVTRSICLETWTSDKTSATPAVVYRGLETCNSCLSLLEEEISLAAGQSAEKAAVHKQRIESCQGRCSTYFSIEGHKGKTAQVSQYRP